MKTHFAFLALLSLSIQSIHAEECETPAQYDKSLAQLAKTTEGFAAKYATSFKGQLKAGDKTLLSERYTPHTDKTLGEGGQNFTDFKTQNSTPLGHLTRSSSLMSAQPPSSDQVLTLDQAKAMLNTSTGVCRQNMKSITGPCFLNSTHIANEIAQKYSKVPVIKVWLFGSMKGKVNQEKWNYHVAPAVPVKSNGKTEWMALDPLLCDVGPTPVENWAQQIHNRHTFTSKVKLYISAADRIGAGYSTTLKQLRMGKDGTKYEKALIESGKAQH